MSQLENLKASQFHGLTYDILDFAAVRGSTVANLIHHLTFFGTALGRFPHVQWRGKIYPDLNCILVGTSGCGKGESLGIIQELYDFPAVHRYLLAATRNTSLTSGKRTIQAIHAILQAVGNGETRVLSIDEECSAQIRSAARPNNTLAQTLIKFIDGAAVSENCNGQQIDIPELHFGSVGHITPMVLTKAMGEETFFDGLGNRFLFMGIPTPEFSESDGSYSQSVRLGLQQSLITSLSEGGERTQVEINPDAQELFLDLVRSQRSALCAEKIRALQQRLPVICLKLALTLALVNREESITRQTMEEACTIIDYSRKTIEALFGSTQKQSPEQVILEYLHEHGRTQRTPLMQELSSRLPRKVIDAALTSLVSQHRVTRTTETIARGRRPEFFELTPAVQVA